MIYKRESTTNKKSLTTTMVSSASSSTPTSLSSILSSHTGQQALLSLQRMKEEEKMMRATTTTTATTTTPTNNNDSTTTTNMISTYPIPKHMIYSGTKSNRNEDGTNVLKLNKVCYSFLNFDETVSFFKNKLRICFFTLCFSFKLKSHIYLYNNYYYSLSLLFPSFLFCPN